VTGVVSTLCIDPSIVVTGYAIYRGPLLLASGSVRTKRTEKDDVARIGYLVHEVRVLAMPHAVREVVMEIPASYSYGRSSRNGRALNQDALRKLNMVIGAFIGMAAGWPTHLVPVGTWKGRRAKGWDRLAAPQATTNDESDAIALGRWWLTIGRQLMERR
jgi:hypothetical protein